MQEEGSPESLDERQAWLEGLIWPGGVSVRDRVVLDALALDQRPRILDRLEAVWRAEQGEPLAALAELAGLKRAAFFNMRRAWRTNGLAGIVPNDTRSPRRVSIELNDPLRERVRQMLRERGGDRNVDLAKALLDADDGLLVTPDTGPHERLAVLQRVERTVQHERRSLSSDQEFLRVSFGSGLGVDLVAVSIVLSEDGSESQTLAVVATVMETGSGLILGAELGHVEDGRSLQLAALGHAIVFIDQHRCDLAPSRSKAVDVSLLVPSASDPVAIEAALRPHVGELDVRPAGPYSFGFQLIHSIGPRIGRLVLQPRKTLAFEVSEHRKSRISTVMAPDHARAFVAREVQRHNADRMAALSDAGIVDGAGLQRGRLSAVISEMIAALRADQASA